MYDTLNMADHQIIKVTDHHIHPSKVADHHIYSQKVPSHNFPILKKSHVITYDPQKVADYTNFP